MASHNSPKFKDYEGHDVLIDHGFVATFVMQFPMYTIHDMQMNQFYKDAIKSWMKAELAWWKKADSDPNQRLLNFYLYNINYIL